MSSQLFQSLAPRIMGDLMREFPPLDAEGAAAIVGNAGTESGGFMLMQEIRPTVAGSRGGFGWFQWTGSRRRNFEAWVAARKLSPTSYEANFGFLVYELRNSERGAIPAVMKAQGMAAKVIAFEANYERAGVKNYASREQWARIALAAYHANPAVFPPAPIPQVTTTQPTQPKETTMNTVKFPSFSMSYFYGAVIAPILALLHIGAGASGTVPLYIGIGAGLLHGAIGWIVYAAKRSSQRKELIDREKLALTKVLGENMANLAIQLQGQALGYIQTATGETDNSASQQSKGAMLNSIIDMMAHPNFDTLVAAAKSLSTPALTGAQDTPATSPAPAPVFAQFASIIPNSM